MPELMEVSGEMHQAGILLAEFGCDLLFHSWLVTDVLCFIIMCSFVQFEMF